MNDYQMREIHCLALRKAGHETRGYANAESCLRDVAAALRKKQQPYELIITEATLKDGLLSGIELLDSIKHIQPDTIPSLLMLEQDEPLIPHQTCIIKPCGPNRLRMEITRFG